MKALIFDLFGVIIDEMDWRFLHKGMSIPYDVYREKWEKYKIGQITNEQFWEGAKNVEKEFLNRHKLNTDIKILLKLKEKFKLALCTNVPREWGNFFIKRYRLDKIFNVLILSGECSLKKPDVKIYQFCLKKLNLSPDEIMFIDDLKRNLIPAKKLGIVTAHYQSKTHKPEETTEPFKPDHTVTSVKDLLNIL